MKKGFLKRFFAVFAAVLTLAAGTTVSANNILERYTLDSDFEYSDEMIGNALKASVPRIYNSFMCTVEYNKLSLDTQRISALVRSNSRASNEQILEYIANNISSYITTKPVRLSDEFTATGSGIALSDDGYIATNQHVISDNEEELKTSFAQSGYIEQDAQEFVTSLQKLFGSDNMSDDDIEDFYEEYVGAMKDSIKLSISDTQLTVVYPDADGNASLDAGIKYPAQVVANGISSSTDVSAEDAAILKIDARNIVSLPLSASYPSETTKIFAAGYPAVSNSIFEATNNTEDTLAVTITDGIVSRIVPLSNSSYKMIQTTATVNSGNSGGPSVDNKLNVLGLNTLASTEADGYYWMIPSEVLNNKSASFNVKQGDTSQIFMIGLQALQGGYGATAKECFEEVKSRQPNTPYINVLIERAAAAPQETMKQTFKLETWMVVVGVVLLVSIILIILIIKLSSKKNKKKVKAVPYRSGGNSGASTMNTAYPPRTSAPYNPPRTTAPYNPPRTAAPYNPPRTAAPYSPPRTSAPIRSTMPINTGSSAASSSSYVPLRSTMPTHSADSVKSSTPVLDKELEKADNLSEKTVEETKEKSNSTMWEHGSSDL